ncbi:hypothetical protein J7E74_28630 [Rhodococcus erythropolis]|nr:hypothetical protein [Rhodococcus erythropolis]
MKGLSEVVANVGLATTVQTCEAGRHLGRVRPASEPCRCRAKASFRVMWRASSTASAVAKCTEAGLCQENPRSCCMAGT